MSRANLLSAPPGKARLSCSISDPPEEGLYTVAAFHPQRGLVGYPGIKHPELYLLPGVYLWKRADAEKHATRCRRWKELRRLGLQLVVQPVRVRRSAKITVMPPEPLRTKERKRRCPLRRMR